MISKCPCENCITLGICQERAEDDLTILVFRKNTKCKNLTSYLDKCKGSTKYDRKYRTEKILEIDKRKRNGNQMPLY